VVLWNYYYTNVRFLSVPECVLWCVDFVWLYLAIFFYLGCLSRWFLSRIQWFERWHWFFENGATSGRGSLWWVFHNFLKKCKLKWQMNPFHCHVIVAFAVFRHAFCFYFKGTLLSASITFWISCIYEWRFLYFKQRNCELEFIHKNWS